MAGILNSYVAGREVAMEQVDEHVDSLLQHMRPATPAAGRANIFSQKSAMLAMSAAQRAFFSRHDHKHTAFAAASRAGVA